MSAEVRLLQNSRAAGGQTIATGNTEGDESGKGQASLAAVEPLPR